MIIEEQILPYPYTYLPAKAIKEKTDEGIRIRWFNLETNKELPPFFGYGKDAQSLIDEWYIREK